jgi:hypothetical protein
MIQIALIGSPQTNLRKPDDSSCGRYQTQQHLQCVFFLTIIHALVRGLRTKPPNLLLSNVSLT